MFDELERKFRDRSAKVGIIGLGYVGLPLINAFVSAGFRTMGFDVDQNKIDAGCKQGPDLLGLVGAAEIAAHAA